MRRRLAVQLSAMLMAGSAAVLIPASPAAAGLHVCSGLGQANTTAGLTYPVTVTSDLGHPLHIRVNQPRKQGWFLSLSLVGECVNTNAPTLKGTVTAAGTVFGWCGLNFGEGTLHLGTGPRFGWVSVGNLFVVTGAVTGVAHAVPDTLAGHSCNTTTGASQFLLTEAVVAFDHCAATGKHLPPPVPPTTNLWFLITVGPAQLTTINVFLPFATISIHTPGTWHIWHLLCVPVPVL